MGKKTIGLTLSALLSLSAAGQNRNSFAIVTDPTSYSKCKTEIENYRESVIRDGLNAFISVQDWESPAQLRDSLRKWHIATRLEGTVFIGDIPVPMIQRAQHMTSAFKMDEVRNPRRESSVPSDRFYDDFDLKFRFAGRDSIQQNLFYYDLSPFSPQEITCDIYSARIKPSGAYGDKYKELAAYLRKVVRVKAEENILDEVTSHTGDGSFSNSLVAWKDETVTLAEQLPDAFNGRKEGKFLLYDMSPDIKDILLEEIRREDLDLILFHEHGLTERQYVTGLPKAEDADGYFEMGRYYAREFIRTQMRYGRTREEAENRLRETCPDMRPEWYRDALSPETVKADSLLENRTVIELDEIQKAAPNVRMAVFDACYNGDFREDDWIANRYIMSDGNCVVTIGNSVNVLQDKSSSDLMGMLAAGYNVGEWMRETNILESHIFGDPTFRFKSSYREEHPDLDNRNAGYWIDVLRKKHSCYSNSLALHKLYQLHYSSLSKLLLATYRTSPYYMERLQCLHLLAHYNDGTYLQLLKEAADDPYEFIRRKALFYMGKNGAPELVENLTDAWMNDYNSKRVGFNIGFAAAHFPDSLFIKTLERKVNASGMVNDKETFLSLAENYYKGPCSMAASTTRILDDPEAKTADKDLYMMGMRNNPYPFLADRLTEIIRNENEELAFRTDAASVLGWFVRAWNRTEIIDSLQEMLDTADKSGSRLPTALHEEIRKTIARLKVYCRQ